MDINIPNDFTPRPHQLKALKAFDAGKRRQYNIWHRRAGKDAMCINLMAREAFTVPGVYWHLFPKQTQARKAIWNGINDGGVNIVDQAFPPSLVERNSTQEMSVKVKGTGSVYQLCGSDAYNSLVGSNVKGVIFSEWALCDPDAWSYIRPILRANNGWAIFITTYRGKNHAYRMYGQLQGNDDWYTSLETVDTTKREDGITPIISAEDIQDERKEGMSEEMINQEYYCLPQLAVDGSYYGPIVTKAREAGKYGCFAYDPLKPVYAAFDLGFSDHLACIFIQPKGNEHTVIGSRYWRFTTLSECVVDIKESFPWGKNVKAAILPKDANVQHMSATGMEIELIDKGSLHDGIELVKEYLTRFYFDEEDRPFLSEDEKLTGSNNAKLIDAIAGYHTEKSKDAEADYYSQKPAHTWHSHYADALRYYVLWVHNGGLDDDNWGKPQDNSWKIKGAI